jgi:hypothetical protein
MIDWTLGHFFPNSNIVAKSGNKFYEDGSKRFHLMLESIFKRMGTVGAYKEDA